MHEKDKDSAGEEEKASLQANIRYKVVTGEFYCTSKVRLKRVFVCPKAKP